jgi:hypothetical protein
MTQIPGNRNGRPEAAECACGAGNGSRTRDLQLGKLSLYQLSYARIASVIVRQPREGGQMTYEPVSAFFSVFSCSTAVNAITWSPG